MKKSIFVFCISCLFCYQALAGSVSTQKAKVTSVTLGSTGTIFLNTDIDHIDPAECGLRSYVVPRNHAAYSEFYVMLLSAMDSGDDIIVRIDDANCVGAFPSGYPTVLIVERHAAN